MHRRIATRPRFQATQRRYIVAKTAPGHSRGQTSRERPRALRLSAAWITDERDVHAGVPFVRGGVHSMGQTAHRIGPT